MRWAIAPVAVLMAVSCDALPGDNYRDIYFTNHADVSVTIYERVATSTYSPHRIAPGDTFHNQVLVPRVRDLSQITARRRFEAKTESDEVIYCRTFTYAELESLSWRLIIDRALTCS